MQRRRTPTGMFVALVIAMAGLATACADDERAECLPVQPTATPDVVRPGDIVTLRAAGVDCNLGYAEDKTYEVSWIGKYDYFRGLGSTPVAADGSFEMVFTAPPDVPAGGWHLQVRGSGFDDCDDQGSCVGYGANVTVNAR